LELFQSLLLGMTAIQDIQLVIKCKVKHLLKQMAKQTNGAKAGTKEAKVLNRAKDLTAKDLTAKDLIAKDLTPKDLTPKDLTARDLAAKDPVAKAPAAKDLTTKDPVAKDLTARALLPLAPALALAKVPQMVSSLATPTSPSLLLTAVAVLKPCNIPMDTKQHGESFFVPGTNLKAATNLIAFSQ